MLRVIIMWTLIETWLGARMALNKRIFVFNVSRREN